MQSRASLLALVVVAGCAAPPPPPPELARPPATSYQEPAPLLPPEAAGARGPTGTAGAGDQTGYDEVGIATWYGEELEGRPTASGAPFVPAAMTAAHRTIALGSVAEVTALNNGRTILVLVNDRGPGRSDRLIDLSRGAAQALGTQGDPLAPVRIRVVTADSTDRAALAAGRPAARRLDAPPALLAALRRRLPEPATTRVATTASRTRPPIVSDERKVGDYRVQVAAFSSKDRAKALARRLDGHAKESGGIWRVRLGPFDTFDSARRARDAAARRGYGDATIITDR